MISLALYLLTGFSMMKIAEKLNIENGWFGFIPFASSYLCGKMAEKSDETYKTEKKRQWSKILLWCDIISGILALLLLVASVIALIPYIGWIICIITTALFTPVILLLAVPTYIAYYKIFKLMAGGNNAVWMLILRIFIDAAKAILFAVFAFSDSYPQATDPDAPVEGTAEEVSTEIPNEVPEEK